MSTYCVAVVDGARARFFTLAGGRGGLAEVSDLVNPAHQAKDADLYSTTKTGQRFRSDGHPNSNDDHRTAHDAEGERRFGKQIGERTAAMAKEQDLREVVVVVSPKMKAPIEEALAGLSKEGYGLKFLTKDLTKLDAQELQAHLIKEGLLPAYDPRAH